MTLHTKRGPDVVSGMRGKEANPDLSTAEGPQNVLPSYMRKASSGKTKPKPVVFQSRYPGHLLSLVRDVEGQVDPATGRTTSTSPIMAKFTQGQYLLDLDPEGAMYKRNKQLYEILTHHPKFGIGGDFWLAEEAVKLAEEARYQDMKKQVQADPELVGRLLHDLKGEEFPLPAGDQATPS